MIKKNKFVAAWLKIFLVTGISRNKSFFCLMNTEQTSENVNYMPAIYNLTIKKEQHVVRMFRV